jgi:hypothetical protein
MRSISFKVPADWQQFGTDDTRAGGAGEKNLSRQKPERAFWSD